MIIHTDRVYDRFGIVIRETPFMKTTTLIGLPVCDSCIACDTDPRYTAVSTKVVPQKRKSVRDNAD